MKAFLIVLAVLLGLLLLPVLLLAIPVRVYAAFDGGLTVSLRLFGIRFRVFDFTEKPKKKPVEKHGNNKKRQPKKETPADSPVRDKLEELNSALQEEGVGGYIRFARRLLAEIGHTLVRIGRAVSVRKLVLHAAVAAEESDETALRFGRVSAALASTQALLSQTVKLKKSDVRVTPDFLADAPSITLYAVVRICPLWALSAAAGGFFRIWGYTKRKLAEAKPSAQGG